MWINIAFIMKDVLYLGVIALIVYVAYKERKELLNRIMAKSYEQYEYFQKMFKEEVNELKNLRDDARKEDDIDKEIKEELDLEYSAEKKFIAGMEEDWAGDEVDHQKLRERRNKE